MNDRGTPLPKIGTPIGTKPGQSLMTAGRSISYTSIREQLTDRKGVSTALFNSMPLRVCSCEVLFMYPEGGRTHMSVRLQGQLLLVGAIGAILSSLLIFLLPGPDGPGGP